MYIEATGKRKGDKAQLISPTFTKTSGRCLQFWYHMYGSNIGRLNIYKRVIIFISIHGFYHLLHTIIAHYLNGLNALSMKNLTHV